MAWWGQRPARRAARARTRWLIGLVISGLGPAGCYRHARWDGTISPEDLATIEMVEIPSGRFVRGDLNGEPSEYPERPVTVSRFAIDRYEVTNDAYRVCVRARVCDPTPYLDDPVLGRPEHPVVGVSWEDARRFCQWVGRRLPTEAEWEYAAKGPDNRKFPWDGRFDPQKANTVRPEDPFDGTAPVTELDDGDSPFGVRNMAGNAAEWVNDFFDPLYYQDSTELADPSGPSRGRERVVRGGSYRDVPYRVRAASRRAQSPTDIDNTVGFRCAR